MSKLLGPDAMRSLIRKALEHSRAEQTEVGLFAGGWALTRFANSQVHQNMASDDVVMQVRAVFGKRVAAGSANVTGNGDVRSLVDNVVKMARLTDENPDFVSLPSPDGTAPAVDPYRQATADSPPSQRAEAVRALVAESDRIGGTAAGSFFTRSYEHAVANTLGVDSYYRGTAARLMTVVTGPDGGFGYAAASSSDVSDIDAVAVGAEASRVAADSMNPTDFEPGEYATILMPYAVSDMVGMLAWMGFNALAYQEGRSFVCGKLGQKIVDESVSIWDDGGDMRTLAAPYDAEGVPKQRVDLIKSGVASGLLYDSYTAHREGKKSTGHGLGGPSELNGSWLNLVMVPGAATVDEMVAGTKRGLLVTRFHYTNVAHLMTATITGMTRDGTFLIENGRISGPVKNLRFTQSITDALSNVEMIGRDLKLDDGVLAPAIKVRRFRFSSATQF